jgi:hypothetical protein
MTIIFFVPHSRKQARPGYDGYRMPPGRAGNAINRLLT